MREEFRISRDNEFRNTGVKSTRLIEHDLGPEPTDEDWQAIHRRLVKATRTFARSELVAKIVATPLERWLPIEEHQSFELDDLTVRVKLDFAYVDGDDLVIVDWKTNSRITASSPLQLACYALFAYEAWRFPANRIRTLEVNLLLDRTIPRQVSQDDIDRAMQDIRRSAAAMKGKLDDPDVNEAAEDAFDKVETTSVCRWCNYQSLCIGGRAQDVLRRSSPRGR